MIGLPAGWKPARRLTAPSSPKTCDKFGAGTITWLTTTMRQLQAGLKIMF
jgi:hypothetical protein